MLHGNEENVHKNFRVDKEEWKFSKEKAVTLTIQLIDQRYFKLATPAKIILYVNKNTSTFSVLIVDNYNVTGTDHMHRSHAVVPFDSEGEIITKALG